MRPDDCGLWEFDAPQQHANGGQELKRRLDLYHDAKRRREADRFAGRGNN